jgi:peptidoglycan/LPS O-acetylase OafA/YrhL
MGTMSRPFSIYLDFVRFAAACLVYLYHSNQRLLVSEILPASNYGHSSVIVFFVLSGFVIAYITATKEDNLATYAASRLSRVYSVVVPAIIITIALDSVGRQLYPELYSYPYDKFLIRSVSSLLLLNEVWFISITSFSNVPFWSICYEFWYYVAFALVMFLPRWPGIVILGAICLLLGPKIVLLAPIWAAGVVLYKWRALNEISESRAWFLVVASLIGLIGFHQADVTASFANQFKALVGPSWHAEFTFSKFFLSDYLLGLLVFLNFVGMRRVCGRLAPVLFFIERPVRFLAGYTFTLYLLHQPLFLFWGAVIRGDPAGFSYWWMMTAMVGLSVLAIGHFTESKRHLLKRWLERHFAKIGSKVLLAPYATKR